MTALLLGATGLVGGHLLDRLVADPRCTRVVTLGRSPLPPRAATHEHHRIDFEDLESAAEHFAADTLFCCLGTTMKQAGSKEAFRRVDRDYPVRAAQIAYQRGTTQYLLVSALGADTSSRFFYNRVKGEVERDLRTIPFESLSVFRPSLLTGDRQASRPGEQLAETLLQLGAPLLRGPLRRYRPTPATELAEALLHVAHRRPPGVSIYEAEAIPALATAGR